MTKSRIAQILFWLLAVAAAVLSGFFVALLAGAVPIDPPAPPPDTGAVNESQPQPAEEQAAPKVAKQVRRTTPAPAATTTRAPSSTALATVIVTAARGDCWISARLGSETGPVLEERLLGQGESVTVRGERVWLSAGAAANVDVTVDGEARELRPGTVAVVLGPA
jgi:hypothetical protein